jgi:hypothetical protein
MFAKATKPQRAQSKRDDAGRSRGAAQRGQNFQPS